MKEMTPRERVLCALNHKEPDRVPVDLGSTANFFTTNTLNRVKKHFNITDGDIWIRPEETAAYYNEKVIEKFGGDFRHIFVLPSDEIKYESDENGMIKFGEDGTFTDEWGLQRKLLNGMMNIINSPLKESSIDDIKKLKMPDAFKGQRARGMKERAKYLYEKTDYAVAARSVSHGILELCLELRGMEQFMMDMALDPDLAHALADKILEYQMNMYEVLLKDTGEYVHIVQCADDYGTQSGMMISPDMWREFIKPRRKQLIDHIKKYAKNAKIFHHTCGSVYPIIPDLIEIGVDILNPCQPLAASMDPEILKKEFGNEICFHGAIDQQQALPGKKEELEDEIKRRINILAPNGGYIIAPTSNIQDDVPMENILLYFEKVKEYGKYK